jgi:hypothetical protein
MAITIETHERIRPTTGKRGPAVLPIWGPATISVAAEDVAGEVQAAHSIRARGKLHAARWHMEDGRSASYIEDETDTDAGRNFVRDAVRVAAPASKQENLRVRVIERNSLIRRVGFDPEGLGNVQPNGFGDL